MIRPDPTCLLVLAVLLLVPASCAPPAEYGGFDSPHPSAEIFASRRAAVEMDRAPENISSLIALLESDDPAVRLVAIMALERLTGTTMGYRHYDPAPARQVGVNRWIEAWHTNSIVLKDGTVVGAREDTGRGVTTAESSLGEAQGGR